MSGYNISIIGNSNDSDLVLASSGASIAENGIVTPIDSVEEKILIDQIFGRTSSLGNGTISIGLGDLTFDPGDPNVFTRDENGLIPLDPATGGFAASAIGNQYGQMEAQFIGAYSGNVTGVGGYALNRA